jgi:hypothetical protein
MAAPLRGTQSLVGQMGWVTHRPMLLALEVAWRWVFGIPLLAVCAIEFQKILAVVPPESAGLDALDTQNPWIGAAQLAHAWALYRPHLLATFLWLAPAAGLAWAVVSGLGRSLVLRRLALIDLAPQAREAAESLRAPSFSRSSAKWSANHETPASGKRASAPPQVAFRPFSMIVLQAAWLLLLAAVWLSWFTSVEWTISTHFLPGAEPDLIGFAAWAIFLSLGFFTLWALVSWALSVAPLILLLEDRSVLSALGQSFRLGKDFTGKLVEINMVMGIVNMALIVLAMVLSAAPLPFSDQLGAAALHRVDALAILFYLIASDYFQLVRLKGFEEFWKMFRAPAAS